MMHAAAVHVLTEKSVRKFKNTRTYMVKKLDGILAFNIHVCVYTFILHVHVSINETKTNN